MLKATIYNCIWYLICQSNPTNPSPSLERIRNRLLLIVRLSLPQIHPIFNKYCKPREFIYNYCWPREFIYKYCMPREFIDKYFWPTEFIYISERYNIHVPLSTKIIEHKSYQSADPRSD